MSLFPALQDSEKECSHFNLIIAYCINHVQRLKEISWQYSLASLQENNVQAWCQPPNPHHLLSVFQVRSPYSVKQWSTPCRKGGKWIASSTQLFLSLVFFNAPRQLGIGWWKYFRPLPASKRKSPVSLAAAETSAARTVGTAANADVPRRKSISVIKQQNQQLF